MQAAGTAMFGGNSQQQTFLLLPNAIAANKNNA